MSEITVKCHGSQNLIYSVTLEQRKNFPNEMSTDFHYIEITNKIHECNASMN